MSANNPQPWPGSAGRKPSVVPFPARQSEAIQRAMMGRMGPEDQAYMARALLQLSDEMETLRQEVIAIRLAFKVAGGGDMSI